MNAASTLRVLLAGERPASGLLHTARLEAFGAEFYGEEAIVEALRCAPQPLSDAALFLSAPGHLAVFDGTTALFADLYGELIGRIWRLGDGSPAPRESGFSVAFDPDLTQARGDVFAVASDHSALDAAAFGRVIEAGRAIARGDCVACRTRAFALRAFGSEGEGAALFVVHRLAGQAARTAGFAMVAVRWSAEELTIIHDRAGEAAVAADRSTPCIDAGA